MSIIPPSGSDWGETLRLAPLRPRWLRIVLTSASVPAVGQRQDALKLTGRPSCKRLREILLSGGGCYAFW